MHQTVPASQTLLLAPSTSSTYLSKQTSNNSLDKWNAGTSDSLDKWNAGLYESLTGEKL